MDLLDKKTIKEIASYSFEQYPAQHNIMQSEFAGTIKFRDAARYTKSSRFK